MNELGFSDASAFSAHSAVKLEDTIHVCSVKSLFMAHKTKRKDIQKVFYRHRLTQINADENHKLLINFGCSAL